MVQFLQFKILGFEVRIVIWRKKSYLSVKVADV